MLEGVALLALLGVPPGGRAPLVPYRLAPPATIRRRGIVAAPRRAGAPRRRESHVARVDGSRPLFSLRFTYPGGRIVLPPWGRRENPRPRPALPASPAPSVAAVGASAPVPPVPIPVPVEVSRRDLVLAVTAPAASSNVLATADWPVASAVAETTSSLQPASPNRVREGINRDAEEMFTPEAELTPAMRRRSFRNRFQIEVTVEVDGSHSERLIEGSGDREIDEQMLRTLRRWKWKPALRDSVLVTSTRQFTYRIQIED